MARDIDGAYARAKSIVADVKGQVQEAKLNRREDGTATARVKARIVAEEFRGAVDELKTLGVVLVARIDQTQTSTGKEPPPEEAKLRREAGVVELTIEAPKEIIRSNAAFVIEAKNVAEAYLRARRAVGDAGGELTEARLDRTDKGVEAVVSTKVKMEKFDEVAITWEDLGAVIDRSVQRTETGLVTPTGEPIPVREMATLSLKLTTPTDVVRAKAKLRVKVTNNIADAYAQARRLVGTLDFAELVDTADGASALVSGTIEIDRFDGAVAGIVGLGETEERTINRIEPGELPGGEKRPQLKEVGVINVLLVTPPPLVSKEEGVAATIKRTFSDSATGFLWSIEKLFVGAAYLLVWGMIPVGLWLLIRRWRRRAKAATGSSS